MPYYSIPIDTTADDTPQILSITLEGGAWQLLFRYNTRGGYWRCDVLDSAGNTLCAGLPVRNYGLPFNLQFYLHDNLPPGLFEAVATANPEIDAGPFELGGRVGVQYRTAVP